METKPSNKNLRELAEQRLADSRQKSADKPSGADGKCMVVRDEPCFAFEIEMRDGSVHAFPYPAFSKMMVSPIGSVLELELTSCRIKMRGERLRHVLTAMRHGYDVALRAIEEKYVPMVEATGPVITEITIENTEEAPTPAPPTAAPSETSTAS